MYVWVVFWILTFHDNMTQQHFLPITVVNCIVLPYCYVFLMSSYFHWIKNLDMYSQKNNVQFHSIFKVPLALIHIIPMIVNHLNAHNWTKRSSSFWMVYPSPLVQALSYNLKPLFFGSGFNQINDFILSSCGFLILDLVSSSTYLCVLTTITSSTGIISMTMLFTYTLKDYYCQFSIQAQS